MLIFLSTTYAYRVWISLELGLGGAAINRWLSSDINTGARRCGSGAAGWKLLKVLMFLFFTLLVLITLSRVLLFSYEAPNHTDT
ncbi:hypothetical protein D770_10485 [Flammeovirgaceae bacterium 311]|nr:hypothetical protein D770_10485 [Flammeovirgaceae bacterium 311]